MDKREGDQMVAKAASHLALLRQWLGHSRAEMASNIGNLSWLFVLTGAPPRQRSRGCIAGVQLDAAA